MAPMANSPALWVASLTLPWGYAQLGDVVEWQTPGWVLLAAYAPVYSALACDVVLRRRRRRATPVVTTDDERGPHESC